MSKPDRSQSPGHRRFQGHPGHRSAGQPGDAVDKEDSLITLESDKATMEVPAPAAGTVKALKVKVGDKVSARLADPDARSSEVAEATASAPAASTAGACRTRSATRGSGTRTDRRGACRDTVGPCCQHQGRHPRRSRGAGRRPRRLHRGIPRRRSRQEGGVDRALSVAGRRMPQRRLHSVEGAAACRQGHHRSRRRWRTPASPSAKPNIDIDKLRAWKDRRGRQTHQGACRARQTAQGAGGHGPRRIRLAQHHQASRPPRASRPSPSITASSPPARRSRAFPGFPYDDPRIIDSTGALELPEIPKRLLVIGGGIIGLEMATVYDALGAKITVVELMDCADPGRRQGHRQRAAQAHRKALRKNPAQDQGRENRSRRRRGSRSASKVRTASHRTPSTPS